MHHPQICLAVLVAGLSGVVYYCAKRRRKRRIVITGACGNLGAKLAKHLANIERYHTVGLEHARFVSEARNYYDEFHVADIAEAKGHWQAHFNGADCVFHFSAVNPYPRATWAESAGSMAHSFNVMLNAERRGVRRVVFASSNHVMGGYKDDWAHGLISPCDPPRCGTLLHDARARSVVGDAVAYAAAKLAAEQLAHALALSRRTTFVVLRIGWCQPGENLPATLSGVGVPPQFQEPSSSAAVKSKASIINTDENWFKCMWLSNADFLAYCTSAIEVVLPSGENEGCVVLNAMSANRGARWSLSESEYLLGVHSEDDAFRRGGPR